MSASEDERRLERMEERTLGHSKQLEVLAPLAVHMAEMNVRTATIATQLDRIENKRLDPLHVRLRRVEYAVIALVIAIGSPKIGGPSLPQVASTVTGLFA